MRDRPGDNSKTPWFVACGLSLSLVACSGGEDASFYEPPANDSASEVETASARTDLTAGPATRCGTHQVWTHGELQELPRVAYFDAMNRQLAAQPELRAELGLSRVQSCEQAERFFVAARAIEEALDEPEQIPLQPSGINEEERVEAAPVQKINLGIGSYQTGVVDIHFSDGNYAWECAGTMVSTRHVITSAHCLTGASTMSVTMYAQWGQTSWSGTTSAYVHPNYTGSLIPEADSADYRDDFAVLSISSRWSYADQASNRLRMWTGSTSIGQHLSIYGYGAIADNSNSHVEILAEPRDQAQIDVDWHTGSGYFINDAGAARICEGDSGGPAIKDDVEYDLVYGVASGGDGSGGAGNYCPGSGDKMRWTKVSTKADWVEQIIRLNPVFGSGFDCDRYTPAWGSYMRCWHP